MRRATGSAPEESKAFGRRFPEKAPSKSITRPDRGGEMIFIFSFKETSASSIPVSFGGLRLLDVVPILCAIYMKGHTESTVRGLTTHQNTMPRGFRRCKRQEAMKGASARPAECCNLLFFWTYKFRNDQLLHISWSNALGARGVEYTGQRLQGCQSDCMYS